MNLIAARNVDRELLFHDLFCGAGGASVGLTASGFTLAAGLNHWKVAINTHSANFKAEHVCADASNYDMRRLPYARVLWASPICTELSPAGGNKKDKPLSRQIALIAQENKEEAPSDKEAYARTRATFHDVIRAAYVWAYDAVVVENVVDVAWKWRLFDWWLDGMRQLDYTVQFVSVSSAHVGDEDNPAAPQWRDRLYLVFTRKGIKQPDVQPRPLTYCATCDQVVRAVQSWKDPRKRKIGKYGQQYVYRCPNVAPCRNAIVEPYVRPAAAAIDWSDLGSPIGERTGRKALVPSTRRRVRVGIEMFARPGGNDGPSYPTFGFNVNHGESDNGRHFLPDRTPLATRSTKIGEALASPPFITMLRNHGTATSIDAPLQTLAASGNHHGLTVPPGAFLSKHHGSLDYPRIEHMNKSVHDPASAVVGKPNISLVIPYRKGAVAHRPGDQPLSTVTTVEQHGLASTEVVAQPVEVTEADIDACLFRMLKAAEHLAAQRFPDDYIVTGTNTEKTMQAGNAVSANVPQWIGRQLMAVLQ